MTADHSAIAHVYTRQVRDISRMLSERMAGLDARLSDQPGPTLNPAGFLYWHILRVWDHDLRDIHGRVGADDIWHRHDFSATTGYEPHVTHGDDGFDYADGFAYTMADVRAVPYSRIWLDRYHQLLLDETLALLAEGGDLSHLVNQTGRTEPSTPAEILDHLVLHSTFHVGELQLTRSLLGVADEVTSDQ